MDIQEAPTVDNGLGVPVGPPRLFALLIGINDYPKVKKLQGAVADAQAMSQYLREYLDIPDDQITQLYNEEATRAAIIGAFLDLGRDERIKRGDAILIFYAGHGCEAWISDGRRRTDSTVQGLVPYDVGGLDHLGNFVEILPDLAIVLLLRALASQKGNNITVILDCCTSASDTPADSDPLSRFIGANNLPISCSIDDERLLSWSPAGFAHNRPRSHVLLAACAATQVAWERNGRGAFTAAILSTLKRMGVDKLSYADFIQNLPEIPQQHPRCEGKNKTRVLFNGKLAETSSIMTRVDLVEGVTKLQAGYAQGVTEGARFGLYQYHFNNPMSNPCLAILEVAFSQKFYSVLAATGKLRGIRSPAYARQISPGHGYNIKVYVPPALHTGLTYYPELQDNFLSEDSDFFARPTSNPAEADLSLDVGPDGMITFDTHNKLLNKHGISRLPQTIRVGNGQLLDVLHSAAAWDWHAGRENPNPPFGDSVRIEMFRVTNRNDNIPGHPPMSRDSQNLNVDGVVNMVVDPSHFYSCRIVNNTSHDLFPYLFYFDASALSIEHFDLDPVPAAPEMNPRHSMQHPLTSRGLSDTRPIGFFLEEGQTLDVGIFKLFVTTSPVNLGLLAQESPFDQYERGNTSRVAMRSMLSNAGFWDTQSLVVIYHATLPVSAAESSNKTTASMPFGLNSQLSTTQTSGRAPQIDPRPPHSLDKDSNSPQSSRSDALPSEVTGSMTIDEIIACLGNRDCADITDQLDLESCTAYPLFSGGFGDIYRGKRMDGVEVAIKTMRLYVASDDGDKKRLNANVLISGDGNALLADFGNSTLQACTLKFITSSGVHITARWAAPELLDGEGKHSVPADIYALGMTMLVRFRHPAVHHITLKPQLKETITSDVPYSGKGDLAVLRLVDGGVHPERPQQHIPDCVDGEKLWELLKQCWAFEPENRPSALDVKTV
ncbi:hypothetical protein FRC06_005460, partial [Ceratobasidium sp. 370]